MLKLKFLVIKYVRHINTEQAVVNPIETYWEVLLCSLKLKIPKNNVNTVAIDNT